MTTGLYDLGRQGFLEGSIDFDTDTIKAVLVRTDAGHYTVDLAAHQFLSSIASGDRVATSAALSSITVTAGVADAADVTFSAVTGTQVGAIALYKDTGSAATSRLICYIETVTGLPLVPSGADIVWVIDNGANRIFKL